MRAISEEGRKGLVEVKWIEDMRRACGVFTKDSDEPGIVRWEITRDTLRRLAVAMIELGRYRELVENPPPMPTIWAAGVSPQVACCTLLRTLNAGYMDLSTYNSDVKPLDGGEVSWAAGFIADGQKYTVAGRGINNVIYTLLVWHSEPIPS